MSQRFQKTFISAQEFVENWDKEIYKFDYLDYFVFLLINHLGNQLENRFFSHQRPDSPIALAFDDIATLAFNIGDSFEYFLQERPDNQLDRRARNESNDDDSVKHRHQKESNRRQVSMTEEILRQKNFRVDLMDNVILDTLIQFYCDELNIEFESEEREISELADFIHDVICDFISNDGHAFLARPEEPAVEYFVELLEAEKEYQEPEEIDWNSDEEQWHGDGEFAGDWEVPYESVSAALQKFIEELPRGGSQHERELAEGINLFEEYLLGTTDIDNIYHLREEHFQEFLSSWLIRRISTMDEQNIPPVFHSLARLVNWLQQEFNIDFKRNYLRFYEGLKTDLPRVVKALNQYFSDFDLLDMLLHRGQGELPEVSGIFEIRDFRNKRNRSLNLVLTSLNKTIDNVFLDSKAL